MPTAPIAPTVRKPLPVKAIAAVIGAAAVLALGALLVPKVLAPNDVKEAQRLVDEGLGEDALRYIEAAQRKEGKDKKVVTELQLVKAA